MPEMTLIGCCRPAPDLHGMTCHGGITADGRSDDMPFDGTDFEDGRQPRRGPSEDPAGNMLTLASAVLLILPISLGSVAAFVSYMIGK